MPSSLNIIALSALVNLAMAVPSPQAGFCAPLPAGHGPVPANDTPEDFFTLPSIADAANSAITPSGYTRSFLDTPTVYNGHELYEDSVEFEEYDVQACADTCDEKSGCRAFNIFFERDPLLVPGPACPNPQSTTRIKCTLWTGTEDVSGPMNAGQWQQDFKVVMAGSNGYTKDGAGSGIPTTPTTPTNATDNADPTVPTVAGFNVEVYENAAIDAPLDCKGQDTYLGMRRFTDARFDLQRCADTCKILGDCEFLNAYVLRSNDQPFVQHCDFYSKRWPSTFATNTQPLYVGHKPSIKVADSYGLTVDDGMIHDACINPDSNPGVQHGL